MTDNIMTLIDYLRKVGLQEDLDFCKKATEYLAQEEIDLEAEEVIGPKKYERTDTCTNQRNGTRERTRSSVYRLVGTILVKTDEDWRDERLYMGKEGVEKFIKTLPEK